MNNSKITLFFFLIALKIRGKDSPNPDSPLSNFADYFESNPLVYGTFMTGVGTILGNNKEKKKLRVYNQSVSNTKIDLISIKPRIKNSLHDLEGKISRVQNAMDKMEQDFSNRVTQIASTAHLIDADLPDSRRNILNELRKSNKVVRMRERRKERKIKKRIRLLKRKLGEIDGKGGEKRKGRKGKKFRNL